MHIDQMLYFLQVIETGSVNAAAQKFFISPQAMNASLKKIEEELDTSLLERSRKGITLTPQGRIFAAYAKTIVEQYDAAIRDIRQFDAKKQQIKGSLTIFADSVFTQLFLPERICDFMKIYPNTTIRIVEKSNEGLYSCLTSGENTVALLSVNKDDLEKRLAEESNQTIQYIPLLEDRLVACMKPGNVLAHYKTLDVEKLGELEELETIFGEKMFYSRYHVVPGVLWEKYNVGCASTSDNPEVHKKLIRDGNAVTCMPQFAYQYQFRDDGFISVPLENAQTICHCLLYKEGRQSGNQQLLQTFLRYIKNSFARMFGAYNPMAGR